MASGLDFSYHCLTTLLLKFPIILVVLNFALLSRNICCLFRWVEQGKARLLMREIRPKPRVWLLVMQGVRKPGWVQRRTPSRLLCTVVQKRTRNGHHLHPGLAHGLTHGDLHHAGSSACRHRAWQPAEEAQSVASDQSKPPLMASGRWGLTWLLEEPLEKGDFHRRAFP